MLVALSCVTQVPRTGGPAPSVPPATVTPAQPPDTAPPPTAAPTATMPPVTNTPLAATMPPTATTPPAATAPAPTIPSPTTPPTNQPPSGPSPNPSPAPTEAAGLFLSVLAPQDGSTVPGSAVVAYGLTLPEASVTVNGVPATVDVNGGFRAETGLNPGINVVEIVAATGVGDSVMVRRTVDSLSLPPQPFLLVIDEPPPQSIVTQPRQRLAGHTGPQAVVSVNGVSVAVNPFGAFDTTVTLEPGPNIIEVVSTNQDGQVLSAIVPVIYRPPER